FVVVFAYLISIIIFLPSNIALIHPLIKLNFFMFAQQHFIQFLGSVIFGILIINPLYNLGLLKKLSIILLITMFLENVIIKYVFWSKYFFVKNRQMTKFLEKCHYQGNKKVKKMVKGHTYMLHLLF
ncbi:hypothetical protein ACJX0J_011366, partial [Zea mays]